MERTFLNRASLVRSGLVASAMAAVGLAACDGPNRFTGPGLVGGGGGGPTVTITDARSTAPLGDSLLVSLRARDGAGLASVTLLGRTLRGDVSLGTDQSVQRFETKTITLTSAPTDTTLSRFLQPTEDSERETTFIVVSATDLDGNVSLDSVPVILGGPAIEFVNLADAQAGTDLPIQVKTNDPDGISSVEIQVSGVIDTTLVHEVSPVRDSVELDTLLFIPSGLEGTLELVATAVNTRGIAGSTSTASISVSLTGTVDNTAPSLSLTSQSDERLETGSSVVVTLTGSDNPGGSGVRSAGITVLAISPSRNDTVLQSQVVQFDRARSGTVSRTFSFTPFNVDTLAIPDTLNFEVTGFFVDDAGNCGAATGGGTQSLPCGSLTVDGETGQVAATLPGLFLEREVVAGTTVLLPEGGRIMDAAVDTLRRNLFLSNIERDRVEVFRLGTEVFGNAILVGSQPWGLDMVTDYTAPDPDSLVVANSGGTNLEIVDLDLEVADGRFSYPDVTIFDTRFEINDAGLNITITERPQLPNLLDFSDRPQFLAVDTFGNRIFSTAVEEGLPEVGTVRKSFFQPGWEQPETKLFVEHASFAPSDDQFAFAHIDDIVFNGSELTFVDHVPGFPDQQITSVADFTQFGTVVDILTQAVNDIRAAGSDLFWSSGAWNISSLGFTDTTFVSPSGDGTWIAIGEGAVDIGRVLLHRAEFGEGTTLTGNIPVSDLITNQAGPVRGLGLNYDGSLGVVRGDDQVAFFDNGLRKHGETFIVAGGAGAALHPLHADYPSTVSNPTGAHHPDTHLAFVGTGDGTIDIIDSFGFGRIGSVRIRDVVTGPLRVVLPFPEDNEDFDCPLIPVTDKRGVTIGQTVQLYNGGVFSSPADDDTVDDRCVVVKLFGVTDSGGVVVIDVRKADILRHHPQR